MPVIDPLIVSYTTSSQGFLAGMPESVARLILPGLAMAFPNSAPVLAVLPRMSETIDNRYFQWSVYTDRTVNSTPQMELTSIDDHPKLTAEGFKLDNVSSVLKDAAQVGLAWEQTGRDHTPSMLGWYTHLMILRMTRGVHLNILTGEYSNPSSAAVVRSAAGLGVNTTGTALRAVAGTKWTTDIADTNSRMSHIDAGGGSFTEPLLVRMLRETKKNCGTAATDIFMDSVNKEKCNQFLVGPRDRICWKPGEFKTERMIEIYESEYGQVRLHVCYDDTIFPSRAVFALNLGSGGKDGAKFISWTTRKGLGMGVLPMAPRSDSKEVMGRTEYTLCVRVPHAHSRLINTAA